MARVATTNLALGTWLDSENPGAGSQSVDSTGLNGNWIKLDTALGAEHNADGTHKAAKIDKGNLKTTVADGSTIELNATDGLRIKNAGVGATKLAANCIAVGGTAVQAKAIKKEDLADGCIDVGGLKIAAGALKAADHGAASIETAAIKDDNVTYEKLEYGELVGYLNQAGAGDPTLQIIHNTLGQDPTLARYATGVYYLTFAVALFSAKAKVFLMIGGAANQDGLTQILYDSTSRITVATALSTTGAAADSILVDTPILIRNHA